jgi:hypothetical protein
VVTDGLLGGSTSAYLEVNLLLTLRAQSRCDIRSVPDWASVAVMPNTFDSSEAMRLQAHSYLAFVLAPTAPIYDWLAKLDAQLMWSPRIFIGQPIVLNLAAAKLSNSAISHLIASLEERNIRIMALEGADLTADGPSLPPLLWRGRPVNTAALLKPPDPPQGAPPKQPASLLIEEPIRSGQSIVFAEGDVTSSDQSPRAPTSLLAARSTSTAHGAAAPWPG